MENGSTRIILSPSRLNQQIRNLLEGHYPAVWVEGEISNLSRPASGHRYFSLKDEKAQIRCALFRQHAGRQNVRTENGLKVLVRGRISLYEPRGEYQLIVDHLEEAGQGELQRQFLILKKKLEREGLFAPERRRELPTFIDNIGVITSPSGAAIRDILTVLKRRWPLAGVRIYSVPVQGNEAAPAIVSALAAANRQQWAKVLIIGRGGGSLEDLWAFNEEVVARAVAASRIPVISAVGHEIDFVITDFTADQRAATPSAAAELVAPDIREVRTLFENRSGQLQKLIRDLLNRQGQKLDYLQKRVQQQHPLIQLNRQRQHLAQFGLRLINAINNQGKLQTGRLRAAQSSLAILNPANRLPELGRQLSGLLQRLQKSTAGTLHRKQIGLGQLARTLNAVSPLQTLDRGYAVLKTADGSRVVSSIRQTRKGRAIQAQLADGSLQCEVVEISGNMAFAPESPEED